MNKLKSVGTEQDYAMLIDKVAQREEFMNNGYSYLVASTNSSAILLFKKGYFLSFHLPDRTTFKSLKWERGTSSFIPPVSFPDDSLGTFAIQVLLPCPASDMTENERNALRTLALNPNSKEKFWKGKKIQILSIKMKLIDNTFFPTEKLRRGFNYSLNGLVVRGHEAHTEAFDGPYSELESLKRKLIARIPMEGDKLTDELKQKARTVDSKWRELYEKITSEPPNPSSLKTEVEKELAEILKCVQTLRDQTLYPAAPSDSGSVQTKFTAGNKKVRDLVEHHALPKFASVDEITSLQNLLDEMLSLLSELKRKVGSSAEHQMEKDSIYSELNSLLNMGEEFSRGQGVTSSHHPIFRVTYESTLSDDDYSLALWDILSQIILHNRNTLYRSKEIIHDEPVLSDLIHLLKEMTGPDPDRVFVKDFRELEGLQASRRMFKEAPLEGIELKSLNSLFQEIENKLRNGIQTLFSRYLNSIFLYPNNPKPSERSRVRPLLFRYLDLQDRMLRSAGELRHNDQKIHFPNPFYANTRKDLDSILGRILYACHYQLGESLSPYVNKTRIYGTEEGKLENPALLLKRFVQNGVVKPLQNFQREFQDTRFAEFLKQLDGELGKTNSRNTNNLNGVCSSIRETIGNIINSIPSSEPKVTEGGKKEFLTLASGVLEKNPPPPDPDDDLTKALKQLNELGENPQPVPQSLKPFADTLKKQESELSSGPNDLNTKAILERIRDLQSALQPGFWDCVKRVKEGLSVKENLEEEQKKLLAKSTSLLEEYKSDSLQEIKKQFEKLKESISLRLLKREWLSENGTTKLTYNWLFSTLDDDPEYRSNATHIRL